MARSNRRKFFLTLAVPLAMSACAKPPVSQRVAAQFMDAYYVQIDLKAADQLSSGLAKDRLDQQIKLLDGTSTGTSPGAGANAPTVTYRLVSQESPAAGEFNYIFEVDPHVQDIGKRKVFVKVREEGGKFSVSQFTEQDQPRN